MLRIASAFVGQQFAWLEAIKPLKYVLPIAVELSPARMPRLR